MLCSNNSINANGLRHIRIVNQQLLVSSATSIFEEALPTTKTFRRTIHNTDS
jgi:hypothetical protein